MVPNFGFVPLDSMLMDQIILTYRRTQMSGLIH